MPGGQLPFVLPTLGHGGLLREELCCVLSVPHKKVNIGVHNVICLHSWLKFPFPYHLYGT